MPPVARRVAEEKRSQYWGVENTAEGGTALRGAVLEAVLEVGEWRERWSRGGLCRDRAEAPGRQVVVTGGLDCSHWWTGL
jgi:hypothetical protein